MAQASRHRRHGHVCAGELQRLVRVPTRLLDVTESCMGDGEVDQWREQRLGILGLAPEEELPFEVGERAVAVTASQSNLAANPESVALEVVG